eukprot:scaffold63174_cov76-Phaeocystis_antarctica.AAC.5
MSPPLPLMTRTVQQRRAAWNVSLPKPTCSEDSEQKVVARPACVTSMAPLLALNTGRLPHLGSMRGDASASRCSGTVRKAIAICTSV